MSLPLLISVPHAGKEIPPYVAANNLLTTEQIIRDGDEGADVIYAFPDECDAYLTTHIARAYVDLNRAESDRRADGVTKSHTIFQERVYRRKLNYRMINKLVRRYHRPYHRRLIELCGSGVKLGVDCHTMAAVGPPIGPGAGVERPKICLSNADGRTCPDEWIKSLKDCFEKAFDVEVAINDPFRGGHIVRVHAVHLPWVQLELSRAEFMPLETKRECVLEALRNWCRDHT